MTEEQERLYDIIRPHLTYNIRVPYPNPVNKPFKADGDYTVVTCKWFDDGCVDDVAGPFTRIVFEEPNLDSDDQLKEQLLRLGWKPDEWNYKKDPKTKRVMYDPKTREPIKTSP